MDYDTYGSSAVELAIDLANADRDAGTDWAGAFLRAHDEWFEPCPVADLSPEEAGQAATTADLVRAVAVAQSEGEVMDRLNALLALASPQPYATDHDGELHLHYARADAPVLERRPRREPVVVGVQERARPLRIAAVGVGQFDGQLDGRRPVGVVIHVTPYPWVIASGPRRG